MGKRGPASPNLHPHPVPSPQAKESQEHLLLFLDTWVSKSAVEHVSVLCDRFLRKDGRKERHTKEAPWSLLAQQELARLLELHNQPQGRPLGSWVGYLEWRNCRKLEAPGTSVSRTSFSFFPLLKMPKLHDWMELPLSSTFRSIWLV